MRPLLVTVAIVALGAALAVARPARADAPQMRAAPAANAPATILDAPTDMPLPVRVQRGRIVVRAEAGLDGTAGPIADGADATLAAIAGDLKGLPVPSVVEIRLVDDARDMGRAAPPGGAPPAWAAGVAYPAAGVIVVARWRGGQRLDVAGTVDHELAHLALGAALGDAAPRWLHEGFAYLHSTDWSWDRAQTLGGMAWFGSVVSLRDLELGFPAEELPASRAYAESYDFVSFLARRGRWPEATDDGDRFPFQVFLSEIARTRDVDTAATRAFGRPIEELFEEWRVDLKNRFLFLPIGLFVLSIWLLGALLLVLAWRRRRRQNQVRLAAWAREERFRMEHDPLRPPPIPPDPRRVDVVPVWSGPSWAPPGAPITEPPEDDVDAILDDDDDDRPRPPPPPRRPPPSSAN